MRLRIVGQALDFTVQALQAVQVFAGVSARCELGVNCLQRPQNLGAAVTGARGFVEAGLRRCKLLLERSARFDLLFELPVGHLQLLPFFQELLAFVLQGADLLFSLLDFLLQLLYDTPPFLLGQGGFAQRAVCLGAFEEQALALVVADFRPHGVLFLRQAVVELEAQRRTRRTHLLKAQRMPFDVGQLLLQPFRLLLQDRQCGFLLLVFRLPVQERALLQFQGMPLVLEAHFSLTALLFPYVPLLQGLCHVSLAPAGRLQSFVRPARCAALPAPGPRIPGAGVSISVPR